MAIQTGICVPREPAVDLVQIISEGTYTSFAPAIKGFVSNAYDADATRVDITIDDECSLITVRDNGVGLSYDEFRDSFASIARTGKAGARSVTGRTRLGRPKIGRFGIGSLAVVGTADRFTVRSVKRSSREGFEATIDLRELRRHFGKGEDLSQRWRFPYRQWSGEASATHFTEVQLSGVGERVRDTLLRPGVRTPDQPIVSTRQLSGVDELAWQLGIICPAPYEVTYPLLEEYLDRRRDKLLYEEARALLRADFTVYVNSREVKRPVRLPMFQASVARGTRKGDLLLERGLGFDVRYIRSPRGTARSARARARDRHRVVWHPRGAVRRRGDNAALYLRGSLGRRSRRCTPVRQGVLPPGSPEGDVAARTDHQPAQGRGEELQEAIHTAYRER
jgi:hypothetical protein